MNKVCLADPELYRDCLTHLGEVRGLDFVVANSLPIPYFGDLAAYLTSPRRILTAALNPSNREFPENTPRFDVAMGLQGSAELEAQLSGYFRRHPYRQWFSSFEPVLNGLEASYGGKMANGNYASTVLHVDMCSPIATSPTWSKLTGEQRAKLTATGREIFESLKPFGPVEINFGAPCSTDFTGALSGNKYQSKCQPGSLSHWGIFQSRPKSLNLLNGK